MRESLRPCLVLLVLLTVCASCASRGAAPRGTVNATAVGVGEDVTQLIAVVSSDWDDYRALLRRYERTGPEAWKPVGEPISVVLGHAGYGWGAGLHGDGPPAGVPGPTKREGDGRSPAGIFALGAIYGYAESLPGAPGRYVQSTAELRCVDDPASAHYNRVVPSAQSDWNSAERMRRDDEVYEIAVVVEHNSAPPKPGAGSCIFLHVWASPETPVRGCTAMSKPALEQLVQWLRPDAAVLVALPEDAYLALSPVWALP